MRIFAFVGSNRSGKTAIVQKLTGELKRRGYRVSVIKRHANDSELEGQGKNASLYLEAGSDSVLMYSPDGTTVFYQKKVGMDVEKISREFLRGSDIILVEGAVADDKLKKIEVLRKGVSEKLSCSPEELIAVVSDFDTGKDIPSFHPEDTEKIAGFLENYPLKKEPLIRLDIDGVSVPMNPFVQKIFTGTITGMVYSLEGIPENPGRITLSLSRKGKKDENT